MSLDAQRDLFVRVFTWITIFLAGMFLGVALVDIFKADCPTEDSCTVDYRDGGWQITEVTP